MAIHLKFFGWAHPMRATGREQINFECSLFFHEETPVFGRGEQWGEHPIEMVLEETKVSSASTTKTKLKGQTV
jgi:hypothetical protein